MKNGSPLSLIVFYSHASLSQPEIHCAFSQRVPALTTLSYFGAGWVILCFLLTSWGVQASLCSLSWLRFIPGFSLFYYYLFIYLSGLVVLGSPENK